MEQQHQIDRIRQLARQRDALILAHNYQPEVIQQLADITGDSLALSLEAARTSKPVIVFCGVHFMAESAAVLAPQKLVLLPNAQAGCPMADMITPEDVARLRAEHPTAAVVAYVNTSAATKAASDICCTSANAVTVVNSLSEKEVILIPDRNLGRYIASRVDKICHIWDGCCPVHDELPAQALAAVKRQYPQAPVLAHPECTPSVLAQADAILSTGGMLQHVRTAAEQQFIIATERGIAVQLQKDNPAKEFIFPDYPFICEDMKRTSLDDVERCLQLLQPRIRVAEPVCSAARRALERMLAIPRD
ncbi:quinolinate synthase NadA [Desulfuromonas thiophila]|uniref:Quinolinate synthase n=1 Tax=Desulfuromonas thiophila TaxID=57664 RepID=A0A1G7E866_9BACT|nr:quinolinate synthase NadA [Desulfuromonas thiophila]SDE59615.1 quinolinate synthetase [Desulfuromonas thiophila]